MGTNIVYFVLGSENRRRVVREILKYPRRQWVCSALEDLTKISHATVFRTLRGLKDLGMLKSTKVNKKDIIYELVDSPIVEEINRMMNVEEIANKKIARMFVNKIRSKAINAVILYGSSVNGEVKAGSDIDVLIILSRPNKTLEEKIFDIAAKLSSRVNKTISPMIMNKMEIEKEKKTQFIKAVKEDMELLYGDKPF